MSAPGEDERLALAAQGGDASAAEALLEKYKNMARGVARSYFLEGGDAEDLAQEGMIGLYAAITDFREGAGTSFRSFARLCIQRRVLSAVRSAARKKHAPLNTSVPFPAEEELFLSADPEALLISGEESGEFLRALEGTLSPAEYRALCLYIEGLSVAEIAAREGRSAKSCENAVQRAKKKAARLLRARREES